MQAEFTEVSVSNCVTILFHVEDCCCFLFCCVLNFSRGGGERAMPGRTKCDVCEHGCARSLGLKSSLL